MHGDMDENTLHKNGSISFMIHCGDLLVSAVCLNGIPKPTQGNVRKTERWIPVIIEQVFSTYLLCVRADLASL